MDYYTIDLWQDESIWSWAGYAADWKEAEEFARQELNRDWYCEYQTWNDLSSDMGGVSCRVEPGETVRAKDEALNMLAALRDADALAPCSQPYRDWMANIRAIIARIDGEPT